MCDTINQAEFWNTDYLEAINKPAEVDFYHLSAQMSTVVGEGSTWTHHIKHQKKLNLN